ncbi:Snl1p NDAI_0B01730 [Naumovozyma dairenensis CBS 421]|uniref:BAG domain-containing protein n=1 Tax=Naumovozyma dairenensis (strain ATCC 10597 / BCRC 20456 / CBS 421 / NBRC 0211 / NRRL Y-12639) TaxID=1071378 RepID=G0W5Z6_NAUDC|nr:hypothetical protein NDAI_0B01730 [Naumovozyma dairenensis CBS 421]CCD23207.1 hypothetical protein NDAI_0B01730 [Naumovozyma dairenensis CBS 421]
MEAVEDILQDQTMSAIISETITSTSTVATNTITMTSASTTTSTSTSTMSNIIPSAVAKMGCIKKYLSSCSCCSNTSCFKICSGIAVAILSFLLWKLFNRSSTYVKSNAKLDEKPVPITKESQIDNIQLRFQNEFVTKIDPLLESFDSSDEQHIYNRNYYNEMLLKLLIELDDIDLTTIDDKQTKMDMKEKRKLVIKDIQTYLKTLDSLK